MKLNTKDYKTTITKNYIKTNNLFILFNGVNRKSSDWIATEQNLKNIGFKYYKVFNKTARKTLNESIYKKYQTAVNGITFFMKPASNIKPITKYVLLNSFEPLLFTILALKLNNKIYSVKQLKNIYSFKYKENKLLLYQFKITNIKFYLT